MAEARTFNFCTLVGHVSISLQIDKSSLMWAWWRSRDLSKFWQIIDNGLSNHRMAWFPLTLSEAEGHFCCYQPL